MKRVAIKTTHYLPDFPFTFNQNNQRVTGTCKDSYDTFEMTCTLFDFDGVYSCWIGMDHGGLSTPIFNVFKEEIDKVTSKIPVDHLYVNGTHTHSGPNFEKVDAHSKPIGTEVIREELDDICFYAAKKAAALVVECEKALAPFTTQIKTVTIDGCYSNRNSLDGPCDKTVTLLRFINADSGSTIGMWMNMSCHATMIYPRTQKMSTDLIGGVRKRISDHYGVSVMSTCGAQGDTSTRLTRNRTDSEAHDLQELSRIVNGVADQVLASNDGFEPIMIDRFDVKKYDVSFHYTQDPRVTEKRIQKIEAEIAVETNADQLRLKKSALRALSAQRGISEFKNTLTCYAINLGELKIAVFPGELVASLGLKVIKHESHDHRIVICYANTRVGYLVECEEYGKNFESLSSIIPVGIPEVITDMMVKELDQFAL